MIKERYVLENLRNCIARLKNCVYRKGSDLELEIYTSHEPLPFSERKNGEYRKVRPGDQWGGLFDCAWFHCTGKATGEMRGEKLVLVIDINGEGLIFDREGCPFRGITNVNSVFDRAHGNPGKRIVPFCECSEGNETVDFWMDAGCNDLAGNLQENGRIKEAYLAVCNERARQLFYDMTVLMMQAENTPEGEPLRYELLEVLSRCRRILTEFSQEEIERCLAITGKRLAVTGGENPALSLTAFGHAHIDLAWLWPVRETKRKGARTFATALELMSRYPDYLFGASSPQLYDWVKQDYPALYEKVRQSYQSGRWELLGAMWVEPDLNLISGESVIRQLLYGNAFWKKEFGEECRFVWTPDTFGYSAALPQIFKKAGIDFFATIKMSWNLINDFPYTNFRWRGIDGSEILVHMPPEGSYVSEGTARSVQKIKKRLALNAQYGEALLPFGIGDGGGGPSPCHLEYLKREKNLPGLCPITQGKMKDFFDRFAARAEEFPVWKGELYLERHLGVYTSAARNKKYNRLMEKTLRDTELLCALAHRETGFAYPQEELEEIWKETLLYQFHDILPGSSIQRVYNESLARYEVLYTKTLALRDAAARAIAATAGGEKMRNPQVLFNTLSFPRETAVQTDGGYLAVTLPPMGYTVVDLAGGDVLQSRMTALENTHLKAVLGEDGSLTSLYSKDAGAELLRGPSNIPYIYDDIENAWNLQYDYQNQTPERAAFLGSQTVADACGVKVIQRYGYGNSSIEITLSLTPESRVLECAVTADWHEKHKMLRFAFDTDLDAERVDCETQFGTVTRSTGNNTKAEQAQIELAAHKWLALRRPGLTFALLNDCKYGYGVRDHVIELNALRGTDYPATELDFGVHTFRYGLYADQTGELLQTVQQGYAFNFEPIACGAPGMAGGCIEKSYLSAGAENIVIDGVKKAEQSDALILRTYEAAGKKTETAVTASFTDSLSLCDLMENRLGAAAGKVTYAPYEILSFITDEQE